MEKNDDSTPCIVVILLLSEPMTWFFWIFFGWRTALVIWFILKANVIFE